MLGARRKPSRSSTDGTAGRAVAAWSRSRRWPRHLKDHWPGFLNAFDSRLTNGRVEAVNSLIQAARAKARGYGTTRYLITIVYLVAGRLTQLPTSPFVSSRGFPSRLESGRYDPLPTPNAREPKTSLPTSTLITTIISGQIIVC